MSTPGPDQAVDVSHAPAVTTVTGNARSTSPPPADHKTPAQMAEDAKTQAEARKRAVEEEKAEQEKKSKRLIPDNKNMEAEHYGRLPTKDRPAREKIDIGGNITFEQALEKRLEFGQRINWDQALYDRISDPLKTLRQMIEDGSCDLSKLTRLQRVMLAKFDTYEERFREIERRRGITDRKDKKKPENILEGTERIFHSGEEVMQALAFVQQTEILAAHALGYEITNGGIETLSYNLLNHQVDIIEQAPLPGQARQAVHEIALRLGLSEPDQRIHRIVGALYTAAATGGSATIGGLIGVWTGNSALAAAIAGSGAGIAISAAGIAIGNWVLSFEPPRAGESIRFNIRFTDNVPGDTSQRITDNPLAKRFLGLGLPFHLNANDYLVYAEKTRHGIYSRLGLRVEQHDLTTPWNFRRLTLEQRAFIRSMGFDPSGTFTAAEQTTIQTFAAWGIDLWMVDLNPANLTRPGGTLNFDRKVRENVQMLLAREHADLPVTQISADVSWRDFSGLSMEVRHKIMMDAIDLTGVDICRDEADSILQEIAIGSEVEKGIRAAEASEIETRAGQIENGAIVLHESGITKEKIGEERRRLATVKDKVTAIKTHGGKITEIDTKIVEKQPNRDTAEAEYQKALREEGENKPATGDCAGKIREYRLKIDAIDTEIQNIENQMGKYNSASKLYEPPDSAQAEFHRLDAEVRRLDTAYKIKDREVTTLASQRPVDMARYNAASTDLETLNTQLAEARQQYSAAKTRLEQLQQQRDARKTEKNTEMGKITTAEGVVKEKKDALDGIEMGINILRTQRQRSIDEIRRLTGFTGDYGQELYNTLLAEVQADVNQIEKELKEQGIPLEGETIPTGEGGKPVVVSKEDKEVAKGMRKIATVCKAETFSKKVEGIRQRKKDELQEFADSRTSHEAVLRYIFGAEAVSPTERAFYQRLLSKAGLVEAYFEYANLTDARAATFFAREPEMLTAFRQSRANIEQINRLVTQIGDLRELYAAGEPPVINQIKILERQLKNIQAQNVKLLTPIYDKKITPFLSEHSVTTSEYFRVVMDRMRKNALEYNPFADVVQVAETLPPYTGPDGIISLRPPDINPTDGSWINRGGTRWVSPAGYQVNGENVELRVDTPITAAGALGANVEIRVQTLEGIFNVLPNNQTQIAGSPVEQELNNLGLLSHLYDAGAGNAKRADVNAVINDMLTNPVNPLLPANRPNMTVATNPDVVRVQNYLRRFGFDEAILDRIYGAGTPTSTAINANEARNITLEAVNKQLKKVVFRVQRLGVADTNALEAWLSIADGSSHNFGGTEVQRFFRSLARALSENPANVNILLLGDSTHNRFTRVTSGDFSLENENGEIRFYHNIAGGVIHTATFQEILQLPTAVRIARFAGLDDTTLNSIILEAGRNVMEAIRRRTP